MKNEAHPIAGSRSTSSGQNRTDSRYRNRQAENQHPRKSLSAAKNIEPRGKQ
jgi:hypothetical protein